MSAVEGDGRREWRDKPHAGSAVVLLMIVSTMAHGVMSVVAAQSLSPRVAGGCSIEGGETRTVAHVMDGDTLRIDGGREVRLIGALAPRAFDAATATEEWPPAVRARERLAQLVLGRSVRVAVAGRRQDRNGRLLAHVFLSRDAGEVWVQGEMLRTGHARAYGLDGSMACFERLLDHERLAREARTGLWAEAVYAVRDAGAVGELLQRAGTFQIVEGSVVAVSKLRSAVYVNFGKDWRRDFTVSIRGKARRQLGGSRDPKALEGQRIRVRGWIEQRGGPLIDAHDVEVIEVLTAGPAPARALKR